MIWKICRLKKLLCLIGIGLFLLIIPPVHLFPASKRLITLAPGLTEIVFALGQGSDIVGNTTFCDYPVAAKRITKVGGLLDLNLEILIRLKPTTIFLYPEHRQKVAIMSGKSRLIEVRHQTLQDILESIAIISLELGIHDRGQRLTAGINETLASIAAKTRNLPRIQTLIVVDRNPDQMGQMIILGGNNFLNEILTVAGGTNIYRGGIQFPTISMETVIAKKPEFIIEFSALNPQETKRSKQSQWRKYSMVPAVEKNNIVFTDNDAWMRPGPRIIEVVLELFRLLHRDEN